MPLWAFAFVSNFLPGYDIKIKCNKILRYKGEDICYSYQTKTPELVVYEINGSLVDDNKYKRVSFRADMNIPKKYRSSPHDYSRTGKDKGHLKPNAIVDYNRSLQKETFLMSNIAPQAPKFNRNLWRDIENFARDKAKEYSYVRVITGVCGDYGKIKNNVVVPMFWYKIIFLPNGNTIGFISENSNTVANDNIKDHEISVNKIEAICNFKIINRHHINVFGSLIKAFTFSF